MGKELNILIAVPSGTHWLAEFGTSLVSLVGALAMNQVRGYSVTQFQVSNIKGSILPNARLRALKTAKKINATHLLFIDSDHTFPADMVHRLLAHEKDVVAANCVTKTIPAMTTARQEGLDSQGEPVFSDTAVGIEKVWRVGTGVMLLSRKAYMQIPHDAFGMQYKEETDSYQGEDWALCEALTKAGVPIYIDHAVSREVGHIGLLTYTHDYVGTVQREAVE